MEVEIPCILLCMAYSTVVPLYLCVVDSCVREIRWLASKNTKYSQSPSDANSCNLRGHQEEYI